MVLGVAAPAHADHNASVAPDGSWCYLGPYTSPVPMHLYTTDPERIDLRISKDGSARFVCTFDVPEFIAGDDPRNVNEQDWYLPEKPLVDKSVDCWRPGEEATDNNTAKGSRIRLSPKGTLTLTCVTDGNYYPR